MKYCIDGHPIPAQWRYTLTAWLVLKLLPGHRINVYTPCVVAKMVSDVENNMAEQALLELPEPPKGSSLWN